jgi:pimeloyl-ACP methyl ester carboxylesterase
MKSVRIAVVAAVACLVGLASIRSSSLGQTRTATAARPKAVEENVELGGLRVTVWSLPSSSSTRQPVVLFSHGFHGCSTQSRFLMSALAEDGCLVFAPNHADATCNGGESKWSDPPEESFGDPEAWTDATYAARRDDLRTLADAIAADPRFGARADFTRLALAGHSLGGYTVLGLAGAWESWEMPGVRAVLALSPYDQPFIVHETLSGLKAPVMYQGGTLDLGITPSIEKPDGGYDQSPAPKYFADFYGAGHLAWTDAGNSGPRDGIVAYALAFIDHSVKGDAAAKILTSPKPGVWLLRYDSELGDNGAGQHGRR